MIELDRSQHVLAVPLMHEFVHMRPAIWTVFEGRQAGRAFVDDLAHPRAALVLSQDCYLGGAPSARFAGEAAALARDVMLPVHPRGYIFSARPAWHDLIEPLLPPEATRRLMRSVFRFDPDLFWARHRGWCARIPQGWAVQPMDARVAAQRRGITILWGSVEAFLERGFGYAVLRGDEVLSRTQTVFLGDGRTIMGIDTEPAYRRQGLARLVASAFIEHALALGLTPEWNTEDNPPSVALALDLGFIPLPDWPVLSLVGAHCPSAGDVRPCGSPAHLDGPTSAADG